MLMDELNHDLLARYIPRPGRYALLPELTPRQSVALLCRVLSREGYNDHIAGHITVRQDDGTYLANPWELTWGEVTASDIVRLDQHGKVIEGDWNITPAINLHMDVHAARHDVGVVIHNHPSGDRCGRRWGVFHRSTTRPRPWSTLTRCCMTSTEARSKTLNGAAPPWRPWVHGNGHCLPII